MPGEPHILIVEDDREIRSLISRLLQQNGFRVSLAETGRDLDRVLAHARIDLVLLDIMLPGEDGLSLCRRLRLMQPALPIIVVSARGDEVDRVIGLEMGADDYLAKPFNPRELVARVRAVLRRVRGPEPRAPEPVPARLGFNGWVLDGARRVVLDPQGSRVLITDAEFDLLQVLCRRPGRVLSRDQLIDLTQGRAAHPTERSVDILVARLRRKIGGEDPEHDFIRTVRNQGYMFVPAIEPLG